MSKRMKFILFMVLFTACMVFGEELQSIDGLKLDTEADGEGGEEAEENWAWYLSQEEGKVWKNRRDNIDIVVQM